MEPKEDEDSQEKSKIAEREERTLAFWREKGIFEKTLEQTRQGEPFVFYDGPPFATGLPHHGHMIPGTLKDVLPRYQTMKGRYVRRVWGWDCHGLPIENIIEKELGLERKKDIEKLGIEKFNEAARAAVLRYDKEWKKIVPRMGRWIDMENAYVTMDWKYSESVWWAFKKLHDAGLIYEGYKPMHICPRCETTLAISEVGMNYSQVKDLAVTVKFELVDDPSTSSGQAPTFLLAWTTTPWTLPGNVALAVGEGIEYVKVLEKGSGEKYILAKELAEKVFVGKEYKIIEEFFGKELVGKKYKPLFDYYAKDEKLKNRENGWKVVAAEFVTDDAGTGIAHEAPAFGEDDMELGKKENLPFVQHVGMDGRFKPEVKDFEGMLVKQKGDTQSADVEIIKYLAHKGLLFAKEKIEHSYPLCWRCDTPLLNYAASSWFVKVTALKDKLISENQKISWVPENIQEGRFGKWLEGARDWAISRSRYWGAPIPVWRCDGCKKTEIVGSLEDLKEHFATDSGRNKYFVMRHGESENNVTNTLNTLPSDSHHITPKGMEQTKETAKNLRAEHIDLILSSPLVRTKETAEIMRGELGLSQGAFIVDERLRETSGGEFDGKSVDEYHKHFVSVKERFTKKVGGEDYYDIKQRVGDVLASLENKYEGRNILLVTHDGPMALLLAAAKGMDVDEAAKLWGDRMSCYGNAEIHPLDYVAVPRNKNYELDFHRPYIDAITFPCEECEGEMKRVPEVFDCWFESGSMPYAQFHYLGDDNSPEGKLFRANFPADFIAEGLDQTRGWFYTMLVLGVGLFEKSPYKNVIIHGLTLAEDGQKMSKKLKNYPDLMDIVNQYGADALRYYLLSSPAMHAEDFRFFEKGVDEVYKKVILRLQNVLSFYELYPASNNQLLVTSDKLPVLDQWIYARLSELVKEVSAGLDNYELDRASKPISEFIGDLSTWYLRRSRERMKEGEGREVFRHVLLELSKIIAPFMPFLAEDVYGRVGGGKESVHLESWSEAGSVDVKILEEMQKVRMLASLGLEERAKAGIRVRQPLASLTTKISLAPEFQELAKEEVNVKKIIFTNVITKSMTYVIDTNITEELREEGILRELIRNLQDFRKESGMTPDDRDKTLVVEADEKGEEFVRKFENEIKRVALFKEIKFGKTDDSQISRFNLDILVGDSSLKISLA